MFDCYSIIIDCLLMVIKKDRVRFVALTSEDEAELGEIAFNQLIDEHETNFIPGHHRVFINYYRF